MTDDRPASDGLGLEREGTPVYFTYDGLPLLSFGGMSGFTFYANRDTYDEWRRQYGKPYVPQESIDDSGDKYSYREPNVEVTHPPGPPHDYDPAGWNGFEADAVDPADGTVSSAPVVVEDGNAPIALPAFTDDIAVHLTPAGGT